MITVKSVIEMVSTEYSGTSTNNNLSTVATFFVMANSAYIIWLLFKPLYNANGL